MGLVADSPAQHINPLRLDNLNSVRHAPPSHEHKLAPNTKHAHEPRLPARRVEEGHDEEVGGLHGRRGDLRQVVDLAFAEEGAGAACCASEHEWRECVRGGMRVRGEVASAQLEDDMPIASLHTPTH